MDRNTRSIFTLALALLMVIVLFGALILQVNASDKNNPLRMRPAFTTHEGTPTPEATVDFYAGDAKIVGDAEWTLEDRTFTSNYPNGFGFSAKASSSGGDITGARVIWSHTPGNRRGENGTWNPDTGVATVLWEPNTGEGLPAWVAMNYKWTFTDEAGNTYESEWFMGEEYTTVDEWQRSESEDVIVFAESGLPDDTGQQVVEAMEAQRETYRQAWGGLLPYKPRVILYATRNSFAAWQVGQIDSSVVGLTEDDWGGTAQMVAGGSIAQLAWGTVLHEIAHLYQRQFAGSFAVGTWWNEGNATFFELYQQYDYEIRVRRQAEKGNLKAILIGEGPGQGTTGPDGGIRWGYDVGYTFWKWLVETYGLDAHREVIQAWRRGGIRNEVLEEVLGKSIFEIEREYRTWLGASPIDPPTPFPTPTFLFPATVTPFIFPTKSE